MLFILAVMFLPQLAVAIVLFAMAERQLAFLTLLLPLGLALVAREIADHSSPVTRWGRASARIAAVTAIVAWLTGWLLLAQTTATALRAAFAQPNAWCYSAVLVAALLFAFTAIGIVANIARARERVYGPKPIVLTPSSALGATLRRITGAREVRLHADARCALSRGTLDVGMGLLHAVGEAELAILARFAERTAKHRARLSAVLALSARLERSHHASGSKNELLYHALAPTYWLFQCARWPLEVVAERARARAREAASIEVEELGEDLAAALARARRGAVALGERIATARHSAQRWELMTNHKLDLYRLVPAENPNCKWGEARADALLGELSHVIEGRVARGSIYRAAAYETPAIAAEPGANLVALERMLTRDLLSLPR